jgi:hypothetical protein
MAATRRLGAERIDVEIDVFHTLLRGADCARVALIQAVNLPSFDDRAGDQS